MRLNHLDLRVSDVQRTSAFFQQHFELQPLSNPSSPALVVLGDQHGFVLVLQRIEAGVRYPENFHLGFFLDSPSAVHELHARARASGADVSDVIENGRGTLLYFTAPDGYFVEVSCPRRQWLESSL